MASECLQAGGGGHQRRWRTAWVGGGGIRRGGDLQHLGDEANAAVQNAVKEMNEELEQLVNEKGRLEDLSQNLIVKRKTTDELLEVRNQLIAYHRRHHLRWAVNQRAWKTYPVVTFAGLKQMGKIDPMPFQNACRVRFPPSEAGVKAFGLCSLWLERLQNPECYPFKILMLEGGNHQEFIDYDGKLLKNLKEKRGVEMYEAVTTALNEYNTAGRYAVFELWNFGLKRKAR
ncbi:hypothetical protein Vadar_016209 [Vaccinium darrowii]|uniref:Uncharacterized protein n=1 Tax=Vaccinium darrowii TaxID=229202 RepID=A0ACB7YF29_9ERIC|nr:hypothetical protein Vadar_016209 [Vaccinium darrowii]